MSATVTFEEGWAYIKEKTLDPLLGRTKGPLTMDYIDNATYMDVYNKCYLMCNQKGEENCSDKLYAGHNKTLKDYLMHHVLPDLQGKTGSLLLMATAAHWNDLKILNKYFGRIFNYLDRYYVESKNAMGVHIYGLRVFADKVLVAIQTNLITAMTEAVAKGDEAELKAVTTCGQMFRDLFDLGPKPVPSYNNPNYAAAEKLLGEARDKLKAMGSAPAPDPCPAQPKPAAAPAAAAAAPVAPVAPVAAAASSSGPSSAAEPTTAYK